MNEQSMEQVRYMIDEAVQRSEKAHTSSEIDVQIARIYSFATCYVITAIVLLAAVTLLYGLRRQYDHIGKRYTP